MAGARFSVVLNDRFTTHAINLLRFSADLDQRVQAIFTTLASQLQADIAKSDPTAPARTEYQKARLAALLKQARATLKTQYGQVSKLTAKQLKALAATEGEATGAIINSAAKVDLFTVGLSETQVARIADETLVEGSPTAEWWSRQAGSTLQAFSDTMRQGVLRGETVGQLVQRVRGTKGANYTDGVMATSRREATALVRSSVQAITNQARLDTYEANADLLNGVAVIVTLDSRTSETCIALDGGAWDLETGDPLPDSAVQIPFPGPPPYHWNCRTVLIPVLKPLSEMLDSMGLKQTAALSDQLDALDEKTRASMDGQVARSLTYEDWLKTKSEDFQRKVLGVGKWQLWKDGQITVADLIDQSGNPVTLRALRESLGLSSKGGGGVVGGGGVGGAAEGLIGEVAPAIASNYEKLAQSYGGLTFDEDIGGYVPHDVAKLDEDLANAYAQIAKVIGPSDDPDLGRTFTNTAQSIEALREDAIAVSPRFKSIMEYVGSSARGRVSFGPNDAEMLKSEESLLRKAQRVAPNHIRDALRGTIIVDTPAAIRRVLAKLGEEVDSVGGRIAVDDKFKRPNKDGYAAVHVDVRLPSAEHPSRFVVAEVQVHLSSFNDGTPNAIKEQMHNLYASARVKDLSEPQRESLVAASKLFPAIAYGSYAKMTVVAETPPELPGIFGEVNVTPALRAERVAHVRDLLGDRMTLHGDEAKLEQSIWQLSRLPDRALKLLDETRWELTSGKLTDLEGMQHLANVVPRGWKSGTTWKDVGGVFSSDKKIVRIAGPTGKSGSASTMLHETAHAIGAERGLTPSADVSKRSPEKPARIIHDAHVRLFSKLSPYERQGGPGGYAGRQEFFAETLAQGVIYGRDWIEQRYDKAWASFLFDRVLEGKV